MQYHLLCEWRSNEDQIKIKDSGQMALDLFQNRDVSEKVSVTFNPELVSNDGAVGIRSRRAVFNILSSVCVDSPRFG